MKSKSPQVGMTVTDCRAYVNPTNNERLKGFASITLNEAFVVNVKVIQGNDGLFVAMPAMPKKDGMFHDVAHPITSELRDHIEEVVLAAYHKALDDESGAYQSQDQPRRVQPIHRPAQHLRQAYAVMALS